MFNRLFHRIKTLKYSKGFYSQIAFIIVGFFSGLICCVYALLFSYVEKYGSDFFTENTYLHFVLAPLILWLSCESVRKFAPGAFGSGIPQVMVCISEKHSRFLDSFLGLRVLIVKLFSSTLGIFAGAGIGREGPSIQISASIGYLVGNFFEKLKIPIKKNQLILAGSAGGLAAAFNTPIGGIVYAIEELSHDHIRSYKTVLLMSVLIAGFTAQLFLGNYLYLGYPKLINVISIKTTAAIIIVGLISGMSGGIFSTLLYKLIDWRQKLSPKHQVYTILMTGLFIAFSFLVFGQRTVFSGKESINFILFENTNLPYTEFLFRFISPLLSSMSGIAGGIFAPSLSAGATLGGFLSKLFDPELRTLLGLVGMIGFLNGVTKAPITSFVLVLEMTDRHSSVFPMMLAAIFSSLGSHLIYPESFYERTVKRIIKDGRR